MVAAAELVRALDRDHVDGSSTTQISSGVAALVLADPAARPLGEVEADLAQADPLLDLADRLGQRERVLLAGAQEVERQPLGGAAADARELRQLGDQPLERRRVAYIGESV